MLTVLTVENMKNTVKVSKSDVTVLAKCNEYRPSIGITEDTVVEFKNAYINENDFWEFMDEYFKQY